MEIVKSEAHRKKIPDPIPTKIENGKKQHQQSTNEQYFCQKKTRLAEQVSRKKTIPRYKQKQNNQVFLFLSEPLNKVTKLLVETTHT